MAAPVKLERNLQLRAEYIAGMSLQELAKKYQLHITRIYLLTRDLRSRYGRVRKENQKFIKELAKTVPYEPITEEWGVYVINDE